MPKISPINCTVLARSYWHLHNERKESLRSAPVWYRPNTLRRSSQNYSHYSRVLERVKSCVPFLVWVLGFYSSRAGPFFLGVEVFSLYESLFGHILRDPFHIGVVFRFTQNVENKSFIYSFKRGYQEIFAWRHQHI